jgi:protein SCO1/2
MNLFIRSKINLIVSLIACFGFVAGGLLLTASANQESKSSSEKRVSKNNVSDFMLTSHMGSRVSLSDYKGKLVIVLFGYTHCPDVCPTQLSDMQKLLEKLGDKAKQVQVLFITFDPERDTPKVLKEFLTFFHPTFVGLTGTKKEIAAVARQYKAQYIKRKSLSRPGYFFGHSSVVYLIDKGGQLSSVYLELMEDPKFTLDKMADDIQQLIKKL